MQLDQPDYPPLSVRVMQVIVVALVMGLVTFLAIVCLNAPANNGQAAFGGLPFLTLVGFGLIAAELVARAIVMRTMVASARRGLLRGAPSTSANGERQTLTVLYQTRMITSAAIFEGAGFYFTIAYMLERSPYALAAAIVLILCVAAHWPAQQRVDDFIEQQSAKLEEERQVGST